MADYRWGDDCPGCGTYEFMTAGKDHPITCARNPWHEKWKAGQKVGGFAWVLEMGAYACQRGCGCLVWDIEAHAANVCRKWS